MNQGHSQNKSHLSIDVSSMVENVTQHKNETMISVSESVNYQQNIVHVKMDEKFYKNTSMFLFTTLVM